MISLGYSSIVSIPMNDSFFSVTLLLNFLDDLDFSLISSTFDFTFIFTYYL